MNRGLRMAVIVFLLTVPLAVALRALLGRYVHDTSSDFASFYHPVAQGMLSGRGLDLADGQLAARYPPGFPCILAAGYALAGLIGISQSAAAALINITCFSAMCALVYALSHTVWGHRGALVSWAVCATYPLALFLNTYPSPELPFTTLLLASLLAATAAWRQPRLAIRLMALSGVLIGLAMLIRPIGIGFGLAMPAVSWLLLRYEATPRRLVMLGALIAGMAAPVLPWELLLLTRTGHVVILSTGGVPSMRDGLTFGVSRKGFRKGIHLPNDVRAIMQTVKEHNRELNTTGDVVSLMVQQTREHPVAVAKLVVIKAARSWYGTDSQRLEMPILCLQIVYLIACIGALFRAWQIDGEAGNLARIIGATVVCSWGLTVLALPLARYSVTSIVLMLALLPALRPSARPRPSTPEGEAA